MIKDKYKEECTNRKPHISTVFVLLNLNKREHIHSNDEYQFHLILNNGKKYLILLKHNSYLKQCTL